MRHFRFSVLGKPSPSITGYITVCNVSWALALILYFAFPTLDKLHGWLVLTALLVPMAYLVFGVAWLFRVASKPKTRRGIAMQP